MCQGQLQSLCPKIIYTLQTDNAQLKKKKKQKREKRKTQKNTMA